MRIIHFFIFSVLVCPVYGANPISNSNDHLNVYSKKSNQERASKSYYRPKKYSSPIQVRKDLIEYISVRVARTEQLFHLKDKKLNITRKLKLKKIENHNVTRLADGSFVICTEFLDQKNSKVDVDFFFLPDERGGIKTISRVQIHKVDESSRYTFKFKNGTWEQISL